MHLAPERFSGKTRRLLQRRETGLLLSTASIWDIALADYGVDVIAS